jgi:hypothetical protein
MRIAIAAAFLIVASDCADKATGMQAQMLLSTEVLWLWWVPAAAFAVLAVSVLFRGVAA